MKSYVKEIPSLDAWKFFNLGGTVLVEGQANGEIDLMPASWSVPIDYNKLGVVLAKEHYTRKLIEESGYFLLALPTAKIVDKVMYLGTRTMNKEADKVKNSKIKFFDIEDCELPLPKGCVAWALCRNLDDKHIQDTYELFIGEVVKAYVDKRVIKGDEPLFEKLDKDMSPLPNFGGACFYSLGKRVKVTETGE